MPPRAMLREALLDGVNFSWTLLTMAIGVALMFGTEGAMANSDHLVGSLVVTFSVTAMAEVGRALRLINIAYGAWLIAAPSCWRAPMDWQPQPRSSRASRASPSSCSACRGGRCAIAIEVGIGSSFKRTRERS